MSELIMTAPVIGVHVETNTVIVTTAELSGSTHEGDDVTCPAGAFGYVSDVLQVDGGVRVDVAVHAGQSAESGEDLWIVNTFEPGDPEPRYPFVRADAASATLNAIRAAVKAYDSRLNEGLADEAPKAPDGDDYNAIFDLIMNGVPTPAAFAGSPRKLKVLLNQYVEKVAEVEVDIPPEADLDANGAIAFAIAKARESAGEAVWKDGEEANEPLTYSVKNIAGDVIWPR
ncbi:MAG: hypothetical protein DI537_10515 [Stutzerimonas stutzeri]|nr:MAG: hypothetical protein DI537_10515 [Stutzerimonas stutzeri]